MEKSNYLRKTLLLFSFIIMFSCTENPCLGCQEDTIGLSKNEVNFSSDKNSITLTTEGKDWWLSEINYKGNELDFKPTDTSLKQYKIENPEFTFERINATEIFIQMNKNSSKKERNLRFTLSHLNYVTLLNFKQSAD